ncbi:putative porin [Cellvibrio sp. OA-2007]|uniref:putative porin n=1 Tax=Cellvibrio sp. OA-2007 TaxID=529823 RepID=UPI000783B521|nr:putative porin [Cellvibrio sp. OA-2007]
MKLKLLSIIIAAGFLTSPFAVAATYQSELSASYEDIDVTGDSEEGYFVGLKGTYYFSPVDTKNHPLAEAAFIEKASNVYIDLANYEFKESGDRLDIYHRVLGVDFYVPNTIFYVGAGVNQYKSKYSLPSDESFDAVSFSSKWDSSWYIKAGVAPVTGLLVWSEFEEDVDVSEQWNINGKYVIPLSGEQALNIEASYEYQDIYSSSDTITMAADYYFDRHLSLGAGFVNSSYDGNEFNHSETTTDYFVRARNFFTDKASLELSYYDGDYENRLMLGGTVRF